MTIPCSSDLGLIELANESPLRIQILPTGAIFAIRCGTTLINQYLPGPAEEGLFRLILQWESGGQMKEHKLSGAGLVFAASGATAEWRCEPEPGLLCRATLSLRDGEMGWNWWVHLENRTKCEIRWSVYMVQDLGLADEGAVRNNEAYTSHYIDLRAWEGAHGWALFARQNQAMAGGRRPWLVCGCGPRAVSFGTDGEQFFGVDHRFTQRPEALRAGRLPSVRMQYEFAVAALQSEPTVVALGDTGAVRFVALYRPDHPEATSEAELTDVAKALDSVADRPLSCLACQTHVPHFVGAGWIHGETPSESDLARWHGPQRFHTETNEKGAVLSFFVPKDGHVVTGAKESRVRRPHGHILRSGSELWMAPEQFGITCYASGIFSAQAYLGNTSFQRLTSVVRNSLNVSRAHGQRIFVRIGDEWRQLGVPSTFLMRTQCVVWHYRWDDSELRIEANCHEVESLASLRIEVVSGPPLEFLVTHQLVVGTTEFEFRGAIQSEVEHGGAEFKAHPESLMGKYRPETSFVIAAGRSDELAAPGAGWERGQLGGGSYWCLASRPTRHFSVLQAGKSDSSEVGKESLARIRGLFERSGPGAPAPQASARLAGGSDPRIRRIDTILPWLAHNAWIHFSAPHGLEQYGGAAWGVRDVTQGSMEWLLASGAYDTARRVLQVVFAQQYPNGTWPQWFMHPPFRFIQQNHSHGDVCFWPMKALADYIETTGDFSILREEITFLTSDTFVETGESVSVLEHCDRILNHVEKRFLTGTALVNYGDGDWDDTLQPADPALRTAMVSAWTVALSFHTFRVFGEVCRRADETERFSRLQLLLERIRRDFNVHLIPDGTVAGFWINQDGKTRCLLHPSDDVTGIRYRLLPMTRSILAELFTPEQARRHLELIRAHLLYPDGVRLMSEPARYCGGREVLFKRADTAANVGREIGLQYVHAHLRYLEALGKVGQATELWAGLQVINPVELEMSVPNAARRQANVYFSSSDADFPNRDVAALEWSKLKTGAVKVLGGWRLYSSGPGIILRLVRQVFLGVREHYDSVVLDPVLPVELDGLIATLFLWGKEWTFRFEVRRGGAVKSVTLKGTPMSEAERETNPYRTGGLILARSVIENAWAPGENVIELHL